MDALQFLRTILPEDGYKFICLARVGSKGLAHKAYESLELMAQAIASYDKQVNLTVYHACAAYKAPSFEASVNGETKTKYRGEQNWLGAKAFWCDIDCGQSKFDEGKGYLTKDDAQSAVLSFCQQNGFPEPMIVDSGGGVHCYWPLTRMIGPKSWRRLADLFKQALGAAGVIADPTRTADLSSVLRPVDSHNRKPNREPRAIVLLRDAEAVTPDVFAQAIQKLSSLFSLTPPKAAAATAINQDLLAYSGPQLESSAEEVSNHCAQVAVMRDTQGDVEYEHWRGVIGIIKHCTEGIELAEQWSMNRGATGHSNTDVVTRYDTWNAGPTTCEHFRKCNPSGCEGCQHNGKITSPIVLGRVMPEPTEQILEVESEQGKVDAVVPPLPDSYQFNNGRMIRLIKDKDGVLQPFSFCQSLFYPVQRIRKPDNTFAITIRMHLPDFRVRDFEVDTGALASSTDLVKAFSKYELMPTNNKDAAMHMTAYIRDSVFKLMHEQREVDTLTSYGWRDNMNSFLMGDRLYHKDGSIRRVFVGGAAADYKLAFPPPKGTLEKYSEAVNFVYDRPGSQAAQYVFCSTYGSLLTPFGENNFNGVLLCLVGESGMGKTTVGQASRYGLGDAAKMTFGGKSGATWNARWAILGAFKNIPVVFDEITDMDAAAFSEMAYTISQGAEKTRLNSTGGRVGFAERHTWAQSPDLTANEDVLAKLAQHNANTKAEAMRIVQVNFNTYRVPIIDPATQVSRAVEQMRENMGNAGELFVRYIVTHQDEVRDLVRALERPLTELLPDSVHRFYRNHAACTLAAARILIDIGVVSFDFDALEKFAHQLVQDMIEVVNASNTTTPSDALNRMTRELSNRIIVTTSYRDLRTDVRGPESSLSHVTGTPAGRRVIGSASSNNTERIDPKYVGKLFIAKKEFNDWCSKNRLEPKDLLDYASLSGWLVHWPEKFNIGRGTAISTGACTCYVLDFNALEGVVEKTSGPVLVSSTEDAVISAR
jgi:uncharacterized protein (DUF927 family)